ncbi:RluA family pseudouridine synthase [Siminovitchia sp. FSL H7-0308]|uniref:Pseudouridine synthase n=1 Tax=Siminovitchia thermophila TaxID=1245522 RepID=A0ABS2R7J1_9BACI|nr:RluA family pseudouridine synthase [Siminovitchia thermophila]MBM7715598.1 23S rRNA pseudouridine1911/1915/1917 synthase [Siminovitchia thermophila]ONK23304.1 pseudouridine synthase [Bacillus sp. VT-16-64]
MKKVEHLVSSEENGERIDKLIASLDEQWSRSQVQQWIKAGFVEVNAEQVKANYKCQTDDEIAISIPEPELLNVEPEEMDLDIYYEDQDVIVVNKPKGMVVHPAPGHPSGTLVNGLMAHCKDLSGINGVLRPGIVHRIDKDTSGLLMVAKNDLAHERLVDQLVKKTVVRKYVALVHGIIPHDHGTVDAPIGRNPADRQSMAVTEKGKHAVTHFSVKERFEQFTLAECELETGRTHQIRVHMKYIGYPLAGDPKYGPKQTISADGQVLHAGVLGFQHPRTGEYLEFNAPLPQYFVALLNKLRQND